MTLVTLAIMAIMMCLTRSAFVGLLNKYHDTTHSEKTRSENIKILKNVEDMAEARKIININKQMAKTMHKHTIAKYAINIIVFYIYTKAYFHHFGPVGFVELFVMIFVVNYFLCKLFCILSAKI